MFNKNKKKIDAALDLLFNYAQIDGAHHKDWVLDQIARTLLGKEYDAWIAQYEGDPEDEDNYYSWDTGIAP